MTCALAIAASLALADMYGASGPAVRAAAEAAQPVSKLSQEPLYADIVLRARTLKQSVLAYRAPALKASPAPLTLADFNGFKARAAALAELDMKGHLDLAARGTDGDLKCILKGISQDLPRKLAEVEAAKTGAAQDRALDDLAYLLNDNVEVITAPPTPPA